jgi:hypothetical protein
MAETCSAAAALAPYRILATAGGMTDVGRPWNKSCFESRVLEAIFQSGHPEAGIFPISLTRNLDLEGPAYRIWRAEQAWPSRRWVSF